MVTRLYSNAQGCPVESCPRTVRPGHLMCVVHWRQVPKQVQAEVWSTWRKWGRTHADADWSAYMTAREAALDVVNG